MNRPRAGAPRDAPPTLAEKSLVVLAFILATGPFDPAFVGDQLVGGLDAPQVMLTGLFLIVMFRFGPGLRSLRARLYEDRWLLAVLVIAAASASWSVAPATTLLRAGGLLLGSSFGLYIAVRFTLPQIVKMLAVALAGVLAVSVVVSVARPDLGVEATWAHAGSWSGLFDHKNLLGRTAAFGVIVAVALYVYASSKRWATAGLLTASGVALVMSRSVTSWLVLLACLSAAAVGRYLHWSRRFFTLAVTAAGLVLAVVILIPPESAMQAFGKDMTLTGRTQVWAIVTDHIGQRPFLGYGFGGFWAGSEGPAQVVWAQTWRAADAHNGYLDLLLHMGLLGGVAMIGMLVRHARWSLEHLRLPDNPYGFVPLVVLSFMLLINLSESPFLRPTNLYWIVYLAVVHRAALELHRRSIPPSVHPARPLGQT